MPRPDLSDEVWDVIEKVRDENGYANADRAIKHVFREAEYDV